MLETSKTLNTKKNIIFYNKVKNITMNNQQNISIIYNIFRGIFRDYTWRIIQKKWLKYSPTICIYINLIKSNLIYLINNNKKFINIKLKRIIKKNFTINHKNLKNNEINKLNPMWITGFTDAEGCFSIIIEIKDPLKWKVRSSFEINLHKRDIDILYKIKSFLV